MNVLEIKCLRSLVGAGCIKLGVETDSAIR